MAITAHLDFTYQENSDTPLIVNEDRYHSAGLFHIAGESAERNNIDLKEGVYAWALGPSYETPAEIDLIRELGGHAVGMSTVPEIRAAGELGMKILTISCLTNYAAGVVEAPITHEEVIASAAEAGERFGTLLTSIIEHIGETE
jgi:purine-nucleoside phosphorylase